ncbi:Alpha/Beta hydrolase protein [Nemania sp. FL0916]|nr:Alpha/Beta hydrolase protein [Nemania sp. FL0916]
MLSFSRLLTLGIAVLCTSSATCTPMTTEMVYGFENIKPSPDLRWVPCFDQFTCANLEVPLDYANTSLGTTSVAFIKLAGTNATESSESILLNPGGPGGSGVQLLLTYSNLTDQLFGTQYNYVGFDPRGVNNSGLVLDCFSGNTAARAEFNRLHRVGTTNVSSESLVNQYYSAQLYGEWCNNAVKNDNPFGYYVTTPAVAHDMLAFVEAEVKALGKPAKEAKLWYYGISYGTVLGATFASLFPDRIGRMVLDGVEDSKEYYTNNWRVDLTQDDEALGEFSTFCFQAGAANCSFWGPSAENVAARFDKIISDLNHAPVPLSGLGDEHRDVPSLVTYTDIKAFLIAAIYDPLSSYPMLADLLHQLEHRNYSSLAGYFHSYDIKEDSSNIIKCVDSYQRNELITFDDWSDYVAYATNASRYIGDIYPQYAETILCRGFKPDVPDSLLFQGSLPASASNTSFPIVFASNTVDPVTALISAFDMSKYFPGSVVIQQEAVGHSVSGQGGSPCYWGYIQAYFAGTVPPANITCPRYLVPFLDASPQIGVAIARR